MAAVARPSEKIGRESEGEKIKGGGRETKEDKRRVTFKGWGLFRVEDNNAEVVSIFEMGIT